MTDPNDIVADINAFVKEVRDRTELPDPTVFQALAWMVRELGIDVDSAIEDDAWVQVVTTDSNVTVTEVSQI